MSNPDISSNESTEPITPVPVSIASPAITSRRSGQNYSHEELMSVLQTVNDILPIGTNEWQLVADNHAVNYTRRDINSIRRKWQKLHRMKIPTGSPEIPEEVLLAKKIHYKIGSKADLGTEKDTFDLATGLLTDPHAPPDDPETQNDANSLSSVPTSNNDSPAVSRRIESPAVSRRIQIRNTHQPRGGHHHSNNSKHDFISMWQMSMMQERDDRKWEREEKEIEKKEREEERKVREEERMTRMQEREEERKEERKDFREMMMMAVAGVTSAFTSNKKRKKDDSDDNASI